MVEGAHSSMEERERRTALTKSGLTAVSQIFVLISVHFLLVFFSCVSGVIIGRRSILFSEMKNIFSSVFKKIIKLTGITSR